MKDTVIIGLGNPLMSDEGIGCRLAATLLEKQEEFPDVEIHDAGAVGFTLVHLIKGFRRAVFIDCAFMGVEPGSIVRFTPDDVMSCKAMAGFSLHEGDVLNILSLAEKLGDCPEEVVIFGIEPKAVEAVNELSPVLAGKYEEYLAVVREEIG